MSHNSYTELFQFEDCQRVEQATTGRCGGVISQHVQGQAGSTLARYGHLKLTAGQRFDHYECGKLSWLGQLYGAL